MTQKEWDVEMADWSNTTGPVDLEAVVRTPRPPRLQFEGAFYHVFTRGNRRERTYRDDADYRGCEETLLDACDRSDIHLYAWCLMPNHFHLLLETPRGNLAIFMQRFLTAYARYFNRRYRLVGHVFQGRYGANLCHRENYLLELVRYIHLNPYRVKNFHWQVPEGGWPWSSHRYYVNGEEPTIVKPYVHSVLRRFGDDIAQARERYARFIADGLAEANWEAFYSKQSRSAGGHEKFAKEVEPNTVPVEERRWPGLDKFLEAICLRHGITEEDLRSPSKEPRISQVRKAIVFVARRDGLATSSELARRLGRDRSAISHLWRSVEKQKAQAAMREIADGLKEETHESQQS
jgi:putative transposase